MKTVSELRALTISDFCKWWLEQATSADPIWDVTAYGLCHNIHHWFWEQAGHQDKYTEALRVYQDIHLELKTRLVRDCDSSVYPFGGSSTYDEDFGNLTMHLNPKRIAWVKKQIKD